MLSILRNIASKLPFLKKIFSKLDAILIAITTGGLVQALARVFDNTSKILAGGFETLRQELVRIREAIQLPALNRPLAADAGLDELKARREALLLRLANRERDLGAGLGDTGKIGFEIQEIRAELRDVLGRINQALHASLSKTAVPNDSQAGDGAAMGPNLSKEAALHGASEQMGALENVFATLGKTISESLQPTIKALSECGKRRTVCRV